MMTDDNDLQDIKGLLILLLIKAGTTSEEIGYALNVDSSMVRKMFPIKKIKKFNERGNNKGSKPKEEDE